MAGIPGASIEAMLANPSLIPTLQRGSEVRSHDCALENVRPGVDQRVQDFYGEFRKSDDRKVESLLRTCSLTSYRRADQLECPEFNAILKEADAAGFTANEKAFIQYHEIGGTRYVFIAEDHRDKRFTELWRRLATRAAHKPFAMFCEAVCQDSKSSEYYSPRFVGREIAATKPWIFGLEGDERSLILALMLILGLHTTPPTPRNNEDLENVEIENMTPALESFFHELHFNMPIMQVFAQCRARKNELFVPNVAILCEDIFEAVTKKNHPMQEKGTTSYSALFKKYPTKKTWHDFFFGFAMRCLKTFSITKSFSSSELALIKMLISKPQDLEIYDQSFDKILLDVRDRSFANALFSTQLGKGIVRVANIGYLHPPGVIRQLERLAAAQKPQEGKKA